MTRPLIVLIVAEPNYINWEEKKIEGERERGKRIGSTGSHFLLSPCRLPLSFVETD
jgi:hypothetical protein